MNQLNDGLKNGNNGLASGHAFYRRFGKRFLDVFLSGTAILLLSPLFLFLIAAVRIFHGKPVFFSPTRPGRNERIFPIFKFRTMSNARDKDGRLLPEKERITALGRIMRKLSLDELPELFNIFRGDMSIVGPRPFAMKYLPYYNDRERQRHSVRPGLTGLAQISGRNNLAWPGRFEKDLEYIEKLSLKEDLKIVLGTAKKLFGDSDVTVPDAGKHYQFDTFRVLEEEDRLPGETAEGLSREIGGIFEEAAEDAVPEENRESALPGADVKNALPKGTGKDALLEQLPAVEDSTFTFSGRTALALILQDAAEKKRIRTAYVPSYLSFSMLQPFIQQNIRYRFYETGFENGAAAVSLPADAECDFFLAVDYFGLDNTSVRECAERLRKNGAVVAADITFSLFSDGSRPEADYYFASLRKWLPVSSGGWLGKTAGTLSCRPETDAAEAAEKMASAMKLKKQYLEKESPEPGDKTAFLVKASEFESDLVQIDPDHKMDGASFEVLLKTDIDALKIKRKKNARVLYRMLSEEKGLAFLNTPEQLEKETLLFLPVVLDPEDRNGLRAHLMEKGIYCPIHWQETMGAPDGIRRSELSLVCDQRYSEEDMSRLAETVREYFKNKQAG